MANIEMLDRVLNHIKTNPETWNQESWRCGTTFCFAGHTAVLGGWSPEGPDKDLAWKIRGFESEESMEKYFERRLNWIRSLNSISRAETLANVEREYALQRELTDNTDDTVTLNGEERKSIRRAALDILDLDEETGDILFRPDNDILHLEQMIDEIRKNGFLDWEDWDD